MKLAIRVALVLAVAVPTFIAGRLAHLSSRWHWEGLTCFQTKDLGK